MAILVAATVTIPGCTNDDNGDDPVTNTSPIPTAPASGDLVCDFVPEQSIELGLGTDDYKTRSGDVSRDNDGVLTVAGCHIEVDDEEALSVSVQLAADGIGRNGFEDRLSADGYNQLPESVGLGFTWADEQDRDGDTVPTGEAWVNYGDYFVRVWVAGIADGRDSEADATAIAQQVKQTLEIPDEWTLPGSPPSR